MEWTLIEPMERRVAWLAECVATLGLENVTVVRARAEDWSGPADFDVVTARAVSALRKLIPLTAPLVRAGGCLAFLKGAGVAGELAAAGKQVRSFGLSDVRIDVVGEDMIDEPTRLFRARVR